MRMQLTLLDPDNPEQEFPSVCQALADPDGLLAVGGCLSKRRLLNAYRQGIFPWNSQDEPILWWSPDPRLVLFPDKLTISRSLSKTLRQGRFQVSVDRAFADVVTACAQPRREGAGTWITSDIFAAYRELHESGYAHSAEAWRNGELVGGLYGVAIGQVFFGESMFYTKTDASKVAFATLVGWLKEWGYRVIDCQVTTRHLIGLGAEQISRNEFIDMIGRYCNQMPCSSAWRNS